MRSVDLPPGLLNELHALGLNPTDIVLYVNATCNLRCLHCYVGNDLLNSGVYYSGHSLLRFIADLLRLDRVTILGGEPFFHPALADIITAFGHRDCAERRITTNLTVYNEAILSALKESRFRLCVSIDGHAADVHDNIRGEGTFAKTIPNVRRIINDGHDVEITHTVHMQNIAFFWQFVSLCRSLGLRRLNLHRMSLRGNALANRHLNVSAAAWRALVDAIEARAICSTDGLCVRYEVGFATQAEFDQLMARGAYQHHSRGSFYSSSGGDRVVIFPDQRIYISSEAFGTKSFIGDFVEGHFRFNESPTNELIASAADSYSTTSMNAEIAGDENFPVPLSVSYKRMTVI